MCSTNHSVEFGDAVVGLPERQGIDRQHPDVELALERIGDFRYRRQPAGHGLAGEGPLPIIEGSAYPDGVGRRGECGLHPTDQAAAAAADLVVTVLDGNDRDRSSVGRDESGAEPATVMPNSYPCASTATRPRSRSRACCRSGG